MGSKVTFDYSKADAFISAHEMESMKKITEAERACGTGKGQACGKERSRK